MQKSGKSKGCALLNLPDHVYSEKVKIKVGLSRSKKIVLGSLKAL